MYGEPATLDLKMLPSQLCLWPQSARPWVQFSLPDLPVNGIMIIIIISYTDVNHYD